MILFHIKVL